MSTGSGLEVERILDLMRRATQDVGDADGVVLALAHPDLPRGDRVVSLRRRARVFRDVPPHRLRRFGPVPNIQQFASALSAAYNLDPPQNRQRSGNHR